MKQILNEDRMIKKIVASGKITLYDKRGSKYILWLQDGSIAEFSPKENTVYILKTDTLIRGGFQWLTTLK